MISEREVRNALMEPNRNPYEQTPGVQQPSVPQNADEQAGSAPRPAEQSAAQPVYAQPQEAVRPGYSGYAAPQGYPQQVYAQPAAGGEAQTGTPYGYAAQQGAYVQQNAYVQQAWQGQYPAGTPGYPGAQPQTPAPPKRRRSWTVVGLIAGALACMFVGFLLSLNLLIPMLANRIDNSSYPWQADETEQNTPVIKKDEYAPDPSITEIGGTAPVIQNTANPVPEIAAYWAESMVGINGYTTEDGVETLYARGSGFVIREDGYILTNFHVIAESASYTVDIEGKGECPAQFVGGDATMDIAVLKVDCSGLKPVAIGSSADTKVGELAIAMGNPAGADTDLSGSVTVGYVSYVGRKMTYNNTQQEFLQIDTAVNPGNSGGALLNSRGEVIGIVTLKSLVSSYDENGYAINSEGLGFAIPIDAAVETALSIIQSGSVKRPGIGILYVELSAEDAAEQKVPQGKQVQSFMPDSPAEAAGLEKDDVIVRCNGVTLSEQDILVDTIRAAAPGDTIALSVWREGKMLDFTVVVGDMNHMVVY